MVMNVFAWGPNAAVATSPIVIDLCGWGVVREFVGRLSGVMSMHLARSLAVVEARRGERMRRDMPRIQPVKDMANGSAKIPMPEIRFIEFRMVCRTSDVGL